jgi:uncharacterized protein (DUF58 family)
VRIDDPVSRSLPDAGLLALRDLETGRQVMVDSSARRVREAFAARIAARDAAFVDVLRRAGVDPMIVDTARSVADPIVKFFRMRELRGAHR